MCPLYTISGCRTKVEHTKGSIVIPRNAAQVTRTTLRDYKPGAGGLSAVNAIVTQMHDLIKSGLTRW